jgi:hypothetical protein
MSGIVAHAYNPSYLGGLKFKVNPSQKKVRPISKNKLGVVVTSVIQQRVRHR